MYNPLKYLSKQQIELNNLFPLEKREKMFLGASKDQLGNSVACYRYMTKQHLDTILNNDVITHENYIKDGDYKIDDFINEIITRYLNYIDEYEMAKIMPKIIMQKNDIKKENLSKVINYILNTKVNIDKILKNRHTITNFIEKYLKENFIKRVHTGSVGIKFSPYFSWSIGGYSGNFSSDLFRGNFYVEAIIPDNHIIPNHKGFKGEKEILTKSINKNWITRIYTDSKLLAHETLGDEFEYCNIGLRNFYNKNKGNTEESTTNIYKNRNLAKIADEWRFDDKTELYLPI